jgi:hypothetical protein
MATQTVLMLGEIEMVSPQIQLHELLTDALVAAAAAEEVNHGAGVYAAAFTDIPAGDYRVKLLDNGELNWIDSVSLTLSTATFPASEAAAAAVSGGPVNVTQWAGVAVADARPKVDLVAIMGAAITGTAARIAAAFGRFWDVVTPTGTVNSLPDAVPGNAAGLPRTSDVPTVLAIESAADDAAQSVIAWGDGAGAWGATGGGGGGGTAMETTSQEILAAVTEHGEQLDRVEAKTGLITAGKIRVSSRVVGNTITAKIGDDHLLAVEHALWLEVDDEDNAIHQLLTDATVTAITFGAGREHRRDEIRAAITAADVQHIGTKTRIPIELPAAATAGKRADSYDFDIQVTTATGYKVTKPQLEGLLILTTDRAE